LAGQDDELLSPGPMLELVRTVVPDWRAYLATATPEETVARLRLHERTGQPLGRESFVIGLESPLGQPLRPGKPGRPRKDRGGKK